MEVAKQIFLSALEGSNPSKLVRDQVSVNEDSIQVDERCWNRDKEQPIYVISVGKASRPMAHVLKKKFDLADSNVICITPDKEAQEDFVVISSHPFPDHKSKQAGQKLVQFVEKIPAEAVVFFALSGGASSLICQPPQGIEVREIGRMNKLLLESGAKINEINCVRKHLSTVKGGQLLRHFKQDITLIDLVISDVPDNDLEIIGGGLTIPDSSTFQDAYDILLRYDLWDEISESISDHVEKGLTGEVPESLKPVDDPVQNHSSLIIGSAKKFAKKMAEVAEKKGFKSWIADNPFNQPVGKVAEMISAKISGLYKTADEPLGLIFYGESTVDVTGSGKGGRNQELALRGALEIEGLEDITWLSAGTDGIDGPTDAAGAIVDSKTIQRAKEKGLNAGEYLQNNDSYHFHEQMDTLLKTGPTGNNVMDVVLILINKWSNSRSLGSN